MKYAILSDIHANVQALRLVLADARDCGVERIVCLGDVVGYGPEPAETLQLVYERVHVCLAGNHDDAVCGRLSLEDFNDFAADIVHRHRKALSPKALNWLEKLPYVCEEDGFAGAHGDFSAPVKFYYINGPEDAVASFIVRKEPLLFVGHTHQAGYYTLDEEGELNQYGPMDVVLDSRLRYLVNPGSVGYPRAETRRISYVIYDSGQRRISFRTFPFDVEDYIARMSRHGLAAADWLADRERLAHVHPLRPSLEMRVPQASSSATKAKRRGSRKSAPAHLPRRPLSMPLEEPKSSPLKALLGAGIIFVATVVLAFWTIFHYGRGEKRISASASPVPTAQRQPNPSGTGPGASPPDSVPPTPKPIPKPVPEPTPGPVPKPTSGPVPEPVPEPAPPTPGQLAVAIWPSSPSVRAPRVEVTVPGLPDYWLLDLDKGMKTSPTWKMAPLDAATFERNAKDPAWLQACKTRKMLFRRIGAESGETTLGTYYIAVFETTNEQWNRVMGKTDAIPIGGKTGVDFPALGHGYELVRGGTVKQQPRPKTESFVGLLRKGIGDSGGLSNWIFDLPTASEWRRASTGGVVGGLSLESNSALLMRCAWYADNADGAPHAVGTREENGYGLYDMLGNARELVLGDPVLDNDGQRSEMRQLALGGSYLSGPLEIGHPRTASADSGDFSVKDVGFRVVLRKETPSLAHPPVQPLANKPTYCIVDLPEPGSKLPFKVHFKKQLQNTRPDVYKTEKLVLRKVGPGKLKAPKEGRRPDFSITRAYYLGIYEVTGEQWRRIMGAEPIVDSQRKDWRICPVAGISYDQIRGSDLGSQWPENDDVDDFSFMGLLRRETRTATGDDLHFDLPTEAQWLRAYQAGDPLEHVGSWSWACKRSGEIRDYAVYRDDRDRRANRGRTSPVGSRRALDGFFDMMGNVREWCLDYHGSAESGDGDGILVGDDPRGPRTGTLRKRKGGSLTTCRDCVRSLNVLHPECGADQRAPQASDPDTGFRVALQILPFEPRVVSDGARVRLAARLDGKELRKNRASVRINNKVSPLPQTLDLRKPLLPSCEVKASFDGKNYYRQFSSVALGEGDACNVWLDLVSEDVSPVVAPEVVAVKLQDALTIDLIGLPLNSVYLGRYEVSQELWKAVMGDNPSKNKKHPSLPVENVSVNDCEVFLSRLNQREDVKRQGFVFRLPKPEEWEFACRAGGFGDFGRCRDGWEGRLSDMGWTSCGESHSCGKKQPNVLGFHDMHGNVAEWCDGGLRAEARGGSFNDLDETACSSAASSLYSKDAALDFVGLRLAAERRLPADDSQMRAAEK